MPQQEILHEAETEGCEQAIHEVGYGSAHPCAEAYGAPFVECALYAEHTHRTHRRGYDHADSHSFQYYEHYAFHNRDSDLAAGLSVSGL